MVSLRASHHVLGNAEDVELSPVRVVSGSGSWGEGGRCEICESEEGKRDYKVPSLLMTDRG